MATLSDSTVWRKIYFFMPLKKGLKWFLLFCLGQGPQISSMKVCFLISQGEKSSKSKDVGIVNKGRADIKQERECQHFHCPSDVIALWIRGHSHTYSCWTSFQQQQMLWFRNNHSIDRGATLYPIQWNAVVVVF